MATRSEGEVQGNKKQVLKKPGPLGRVLHFSAFGMHGWNKIMRAIFGRGV